MTRGMLGIDSAREPGRAHRVVESRLARRRESRPLRLPPPANRVPLTARRTAAEEPDIE